MEPTAELVGTGVFLTRPLRLFISFTSVLIESWLFKDHSSDPTSYLSNTFWYREGSMHWMGISFTKALEKYFPPDLQQEMRL